MSLELLTKSIDDHGKAVADLARKHDETKEIAEKALESVQNMEMKGVKLRGGFGGSKTDAIGVFVKSQGMADIRNGAKDTGRVELPSLSIKTLVNAGRGQTGDSQYQGVTERAAGVFNDPRQSLQLLDALRSIPVSGGTYEFTQLKSFTNNADYQVLEGTLKAESNMELQQAVANVDTIAHWTRASVQVLDDEPSLQTYIGNLLGYGLLAKLEDAVINGQGGTGKILGLVKQALAFTPTASDSPVDRIGAAAAEMKAAGWRPSMVIMNPLDWFDVDKSKNANGEYLLGGPQSPAPASLWRNGVIETPSMARGQALLLDAAQVAILDRMRPVLIASRFDRDNLVTNLVTLLSELRAGLAVFAPAAVRLVPLTTTASK